MLFKLSLLSTHPLSELEPSYLFGVFDKLKELNIHANDPFENLHPRQDLMATLCETVSTGPVLKSVNHGDHGGRHIAA